MRKHIVLIALAILLSLAIGMQFVTSQVHANVISADVDIDPDALQLKEDGYGKWITAYIDLPQDYDVNNINISSVTLGVLGGQVSVSKYDVQGDVLMVKFDRAIVISFLWSMVVHMSPRVKQELSLTVVGNLYDGDAFEGSDTIKVFYTH
jgi:hypothetical protein